MQEHAPQLLSESPTHKGTNLIMDFFIWGSVAAGMTLSVIGETKSKYSPPSLQRLCRLEQPDMYRDLRVRSCWRRPCGNLSIPGQYSIVNRSREVRPCIPSGSAFSSSQPTRLKWLNFGRSPRFEGSATKFCTIQ